MSDQIPILKEIKLNYENEENLQKSFISQFEPECPLYIDLTEHEKNKPLINSERVIQLLEDVIYDVEWYFYYPIYIISNNLESHRLFSITRSLSEIPKHFQRSIKVLRGRELLLLKKLKIIQGRLKTTQLNSRIALVKYQSENLKTIKDLSFEANFYQKILDQIKKYKSEVV